MSLVNFTKQYTTTKNKKKLNKKTERMKIESRHNRNTNEMMRTPEITTEELQTAINKLEKGKSADSNGMRGEVIEACDEETKEMVKQTFNEVIKQKEGENKSDTQKKG